MKIFEIPQMHRIYQQVDGALRTAFAEVPEKFHSNFQYTYFRISIDTCNLELALEILEELTVGLDTDFSRKFWENMEIAARGLLMHDEEEYYRDRLHSGISPVIGG